MNRVKSKAAQDIEKIAVPVALVSCEGRRLPLFNPIGVQDQMEFDKIICRNGIKEFVRPIFAGEIVHGLLIDEGFEKTHVVVIEEFTGQRLKRVCALGKLASV